MSSRTKATFESLKKLTDHGKNYAEYRAALRKCAPPALPFLGLYLTDLTFTDDGNPDLRNNGKLINFVKYSKTARIIENLMMYQVPFGLNEVLEIRDYLLKSIEIDGIRDIQELHEISLKLEPRENLDAPNYNGSVDGFEMDTKLEMLEKAGML